MASKPKVVRLFMSALRLVESELAALKVLSANGKLSAMQSRDLTGYVRLLKDMKVIEDDKDARRRKAKDKAKAELTEEQLAALVRTNDEAN